MKVHDTVTCHIVLLANEVTREGRIPYAIHVSMPHGLTLGWLEGNWAAGPMLIGSLKSGLQ